MPPKAHGTAHWVPCADSRELLPGLSKPVSRQRLATLAWPSCPDCPAGGAAALVAHRDVSGVSSDTSRRFA